jgi:hypothetical protein
MAIVNLDNANMDLGYDDYFGGSTDPVGNDDPWDWSGYDWGFDDLDSDWLASDDFWAADWDEGWEDWDWTSLGGEGYVSGGEEVDYMSDIKAFGMDLLDKEEDKSYFKSFMEELEKGDEDEKVDKEGVLGKVQNFLNTKLGTGLALGALTQMFIAYQEGKSSEKEGEQAKIIREEREKDRQLQRELAAMRKSGGGGGRQPSKGITPLSDETGLGKRLRGRFRKL